MAVSPLKTWIDGEVLTASDLNAMNTHILNNGEDLGSPRVTKGFDMNGFELVLDANGDTSITADTPNQIDFRLGGTDVVVMTVTDITHGGISLKRQTRLTREAGSAFAVARANQLRVNSAEIHNNATTTLTFT
jgi:hypothetical protein